MPSAGITKRSAKIIAACTPSTARDHETQPTARKRMDGSLAPPSAVSLLIAPIVARLHHRTAAARLFSAKNTALPSPTEPRHYISNVTSHGRARSTTTPHVHRNVQALAGRCRKSLPHSKQRSAGGLFSWSLDGQGVDSAASSTTTLRHVRRILPL